MTSPSVQAALESAIHTCDAVGVHAALAAGADPNAPNAHGVPPLGQSAESPWLTKVMRRHLGRVPAISTRLYRARHAVRQALVAAGADPAVTWISPYSDPPATVSLTQCIHHEEAYRFHQAHGVDALEANESLARVTAWLPVDSVAWVLGPPDHSWLDQLDWELYNLANDHHQRAYPAAFHAYLAGLIVALVEHHPAIAATWRTQLDTEGAPGAHLGLPQPFEALVAQGEHQARAHRRLTELVAPPATPSGSRRYRT